MTGPNTRPPSTDASPVQMMSGGLVAVIGAALLVFGSPAAPGEGHFEETGWRQRG